MIDIESIKEQVKMNCNISDARYWGYYSICGLLMRLRNLYRSEKAMKPWDRIPLEDIGPWLEEREALWQELESEDFRNIIINGISYDPFDFDKINNKLKPYGLIYGSGYGLYQKPTFFLAELDYVDEVYGYEVYYLGRELSRDLFCSPAMLQGKTIFLRRETALAFLWDRLIEVYPKKIIPVELLGFTIEELKTSPSSSTVKKLESLADRLAQMLLFHELGEVFEDEASQQWLKLLSNSKDKKKELYLRAVKDIIADTSEWGPLRRAIETEDVILLSLYILMLEPIRKELFPEILSFFQKDPFHPDWKTLDNLRVQAYRKFKGLYQEALKLEQ